MRVLNETMTSLESLIIIIHDFEADHYFDQFNELFGHFTMLKEFTLVIRGGFSQKQFLDDLLDKDNKITINAPSIKFIFQDGLDNRKYLVKVIGKIIQRFHGTLQTLSFNNLSLSILSKGIDQSLIISLNNDDFDDNDDDGNDVKKKKKKKNECQSINIRRDELKDSKILSVAITTLLGQCEVKTYDDSIRTFHPVIKHTLSKFPPNNPDDYDADRLGRHLEQRWSFFKSQSESSLE
ncbi:hypothetical protein SAMD00019534_092040 [Acytostelium subglobosum LB1]|uniref:hypothetical protein n=1 Tax=Acytostelium subglobosum LB1 TaxID=1410327 RepID=UPI00064507DB|nr:hypothetical protein SAMD00019534_092040 [Acytostelium subglobosum LB1]GAM26029.1 hypothetical protein SAMD00019534_092040 [Acytostelium subglobosum LB1]|eukprot:XP_012751072.1 hypothetical protein SAMD00019534_092040 [Acytostelium subglobosum LB1]